MAMLEYDTGPPQRKRGFLSNPRLQSGIIGGLTQPSEGGFLGGLFAGLSGSLGGIQRYAQGTHEQERQQIRDMLQERQAQMEQARLDETIRHNRAIEGRQAAPQAPGEDFTVPYTNTEGDSERALPPYLEGVPPALRKAAGQQYFEKQFASPQQPDPFSTWLKKEHYRETNPKPPAQSAADREMVGLINSMDPFNAEHRKRLEAIVKNPPTPEAAQAAERKIRSGMNWRAQ